jgi:hypothetical protein
MVQVKLRAGAIAVQTTGRPGICHGAGFGSKPVAQRSRYKFVTEPENCHGAEVCFRADERIRVPGQQKSYRKQKPMQKP